MEENKIFFYIDTREKEDKVRNILKEKILQTYKNINIIEKALELGDYQFYYNNTLLSIFERKEINDFYKSIDDNRFFEQRMKLYNYNTNLSLNSEKYKINKCFLIEGTFDNLYTKNKNIKSIFSSAIGSTISLNISVYKTNNLEETIDFFIKLIRGYLKYGEILLNNLKINEQNIIFDSKIQKSEFDTFSVMSLKLIPGVSTNIAKNIIKKYKSLKNLYNIYENTKTEKECELLLKDILMDNKECKVLSKKIYEYLMNKETYNLDNKEIKDTETIQQIEYKEINILNDSEKLEILNNI